MRLETSGKQTEENILPMMLGKLQKYAVPENNS